MSCNRQSVALTDLIERQARLSTENAQLTQQVRELRRSYLNELDAKEEDFADYASTLKQLNDTAESMRLSLVHFGEYKSEYRRVTRLKAPGMQLGDLNVGTRTLKGTKVKEVTDTHIALAHKDGSTRLLLSEAPAKLQDLFAYDPSLDVLLQETTGTGTDWLLSAMAAAQQYANAHTEARQPQAARIAASTSSATSNVSSPSYTPTSSYYQTSRPTWQRFSNFTGSFWSPLQNRKKVVGSVNTFSSGMLDCPY